MLFFEMMSFVLASYRSSETAPDFLRKSGKLDPSLQRLTECSVMYKKSGISFTFASSPFDIDSGAVRFITVAGIACLLFPPVF
jgi:hypothetical protein